MTGFGLNLASPIMTLVVKEEKQFRSPVRKSREPSGEGPTTLLSAPLQGRQSGIIIVSLIISMGRESLASL